MKQCYLVSLALLLQATTACGQSANEKTKNKKKSTTDTLSTAYVTKSEKGFSNVVGWENGAKPTAPAGFTVTKYADGLENPRKLYVLPNGDVLAAEASTINTGLKKIGANIIGAAKSENKHVGVNRITLLRDTKENGVSDMHETFLEDLHQPFGMLLLGTMLYVANTNAVIRYPYKTGQTKITAQGEKIADLKIGGTNNRHWTRSLIANPEGNKIYIGSGSGSNIAENGIEKELLRANILEMNKDGTGLKVYASGLRNPVGLGWAPGTHTLWASVNERDELGDKMVPDYFTSIKPGGFYGWPYSYWGQHVDTRVKDTRMDLVKKAIVPDVALGSHVAALGMTFYTGKAFPERYRNGAFIAEHGSWNSSVLQGYKVVFIPFANGKPSGPPEDFLTGFIADMDKKDVHGRPVDVVMMADGSILVSDDVTNTIWRVSANK